MYRNNTKSLLVPIFDYFHRRKKKNGWIGWQYLLLREHMMTLYREFSITKNTTKPAKIDSWEPKCYNIYSTVSFVI